MRKVLPGLALLALVGGVLAAIFAHGKLAGYAIVVAALVLLAVFGEAYVNGGADYDRKGEVFRRQAEDWRRGRR